MLFGAAVAAVLTALGEPKNLEQFEQLLFSWEPLGSRPRLQAPVRTVFNPLKQVGRFLQRTELLSLDFRYRNRPAVPVRSDIGYVDFDDTSIAVFGRWVWPRSRQVTLVRTLDRYDARALGYDVFFSEHSEIILDADRALQEVAAGVGTAGTAGPSGASAFRDDDAEFETAMRDAGNIYLAQFMVQPDSTIAAGRLPAIRAYVERAQAEFTPEKREALALSDQYARDADSLTEDRLYKAIDAVPPLPRFGAACAGIGYAQIVKDLDQTVRLYPLFMYYDGRVFSSIAVVMLSRVLQVPTEAIRVIPGEYVEFPNAVLPIAAGYPGDGSTPSASGNGVETRTIRIPVDANGQMLVNWAGGFLDRGLHLSFRTLSTFHAHDVAKEIARGLSPVTRSGFISSPSGLKPPERALGRTDEATSRNLAVAILAIADELKRERLVLGDEAETIAEQTAVAHLASARLEAGEDPVVVAGEIELVRPSSGLRLTSAEIVTICRAVALAQRCATDTAAFDNALDATWQAAIQRSVAFFAARGALTSAEPLYFAPPVLVPWDGALRPFAAVDLENKILMAGLAGVGTIDLNPMPFDNACPMVALHSTALNTILTDRFLQFPDPTEHVLLLWGLAITAGVLCSLLSPGKAYVACSVLVVGYSWHVYSRWLNEGRWVSWVEPVLAVTAIYVVEAAVSFVKAVRERQKVRGIFSTMVSPKVLKLMEDNPDRFSLTGERKPATIFFSAIDGFGSVTQREAPEELGSILGQYLTPCSEIIMDYDGYIDKYEGHVIMADFGVPLDDPDHPWKCCFAALEQQQDIRAFRTFVLARYGADVRVSMGVNSGFISAGNMGSEKKMQYTVMGDAVNVAARFRPANGIYGTDIITGEAMEPMLRDRVELRMLDRLLLKGKTKPTTLYEVMGWKEEAYLDAKRDKPVPNSLLVRWIKAPPQKVYGYAAYWREQEQEWGLPLAGEIATFFESQEPLMEMLITRGALVGMHSLKQEMDALAAHIHRIEGMEASAAQDEVGAGAGSTTKLTWQSRLSVWKTSIEMIRDEIEEKQEAGVTVPEGVPSLPELRMRAINLLGKITTLTENLGRKPKSWIPAVGQALEVMRQWFEGVDDPTALEQLKQGKLAYSQAVEAFYGRIAARPTEYHALIAKVGSLSAKRAEVRQRYETALKLHWERRWDDALAELDAAAALDPEDGPVRSIRERVSGYKAMEPGPAWQGEFVQTKK